MENLVVAASSYAKDIDNLIWIIAILGGFWFFLAEGVLFYFLIKFRHKEGQKAQYLVGESKEELKWITRPHHAILICDLVIVFMAIQVWYNIKQQLPPADETIQVVGHQWSWRFIHPGLDHQLGTADDVEVVDELHVRVDKTYHFKLEAADVLHSFSIPAFRLKQDAIPGRVITGWFKPTKTGEYDLQCAEMCGIGHGIMQSKLYVETDEQHDEWLKKQMPQQQI